MDAPQAAFNALARDLGVASRYKFVDVLGLDDELLPAAASKSSESPAECEPDRRPSFKGTSERGAKVAGGSQDR